MKRLAIYGDSISTPEVSNGGYVQYLPQRFPGLEVQNHAVWGSGFCREIPGSLPLVLLDPQNLPRGCDVILLWLGTNDWYFGTPLGSPNDGTLLSFSGSLQCCLCTLRKAAPQASVVCLTPLYRFGEAAECRRAGNARTTPNKVGATLQDYSRALVSTAQQNGCTVVDMPVLTGICEKNAQDYLFDGIHPNEKGCLQIAQALQSVLEEL